MKNKVLHSVLSTLVTAIVLLPFALQTLHAFESHEHNYCNAENEKHFHKEEIDCHFYHLKITYNSFDFNNGFTIIEPTVYFQLFDSYNQTYHSSFQSSKSSRAPPCFIV
ncbi:hypothetical protein UMM65_12725 [Aureibaculum sp. 2210JD6-5]|uniref:hypothetical protein n=1 Tax=Aureibaculum sp. 2210JD6-5 TaxID=3103957 RepID=UPI002AAD4E72|nr:hypothetical protein [Aureibaculum sp. 2210JD6-5]MDY7396107.1 hypothetical protein [Aureibaculum sp. 2210JD6-5]